MPVTPDSERPQPEAPAAVSVDPLTLPDRAAREFAVDPTRHVVLEASAGTGKTRVLVDRYLNLLSAGVDPANILAITFTRKAASEMRDRIVRALREAATRSHEQKARWLELRDRLGDIAICTIDAFCLSLLREFPLEADLDPCFEVADETELPRLAEEALDRTLRAARHLARRDEEIALLWVRLGESRLRSALHSLLDRRLVAVRALGRFVSQLPADLTIGSASAAAAERLKAILHGDRDLAERFLADGPVAHPDFVLLCKAVEAACETADPVRVWVALDHLARHVFTDEGAPRKRRARRWAPSDFRSKEAGQRHLAAIGALAPAIGDTLRAFERDLNGLMVRALRRLFRIARTEYRRALGARTAVDFPEMLAGALGLLGRMDEFAQSRYRLEARYHHVLVDEFQDTSRAQWHLVRRLIASWSEGAGLAGGAGLQPTVFVVGDRKQSIYAFRDAEVRVFGVAARHIARLREHGDVRRSLRHSFRAVPGLQAFTNSLFAALDSRTASRGAFRFRPSDRFPVTPDTTDDVSLPVSLIAGEDTDAVARDVASEVVRLTTTGVVRDPKRGTYRQATPGDIAVLFRTRAVHKAFEDALVARGIPTYVYKGLGFFDADEVKDLVALLRFLAAPESDLRAAALLRSRLVRLSDRALSALAPDLSAALLADRAPAAESVLDADDRAVLVHARAAVQRWLALADRVPPADLIDRILDESGYCFELRGPRLTQAAENVKKFRRIVRRAQNRGYLTLGRIADHVGRLATGEEANAIIDAAGAVSLMTIHAAKGLEFPIVFVVGLERGAGGRSGAVLLAPGEPDRLPLVSVDGLLEEAATAARAQELEETKRLLYVAVTRARDRLYLAASLKDGKLQTGRGSLSSVLPKSFRAVVEQAPAHRGRSIDWVGPDGRVNRLAVCSGGEAVETDAAARAAASAERTAADVALGQAGEAGQIRDDFGALADTAAVTRVSAVAAARAMTGGEVEPRPPAAGLRDEAALAGTLVHRLFQFDRASWTDERDVEDCVALARHLCRPEEHLAIDEPSRFFVRVAEIYRALRLRPDVQAVLQGGACLFELPFSYCDEDASPAGERRIVRGAIDCLVQRLDGSLCVIDFKTGRPTAADRAQIDLYVQVARVLGGGAPVESHLFYSGVHSPKPPEPGDETTSAPAASNPSESV